jgi:hypothetical protein
MNRYAARWILMPCLALVAISAVNYQFWISNQIATERVALATLTVGEVPIAASRNEREEPLEGSEVLWRLHVSMEALARLSKIELAYEWDGGDPASVEWTRVPLGAQDQLQVSLAPFTKNLIPRPPLALLIRVTDRDGKFAFGKWDLEMKDP